VLWVDWAASLIRNSNMQQIKYNDYKQNGYIFVNGLSRRW
jgi:hypothetical protein